MRIIRILIKSSLPLFLLASLASVLTGLASTLLITSILQAVQSDELVLRSFIIEFTGYWFAYGILAIIASYSVALLTQKIIHKLRIDLSSRILEASFDSVESNQSKLLPILTEDIKTIAYSIDRLPGVTTGLATVIGLLGYMIWFSPQLSLATFGLFFLVFLFTKISLPFVKKYADKSRGYLENLFTQFQGLILGIKQLTLNKEFKDSYLRDQIKPTSQLQNKFYLKENVVSAITNRSTDLILLGGMGGIIVAIATSEFVSRELFSDFLPLVLFTLAPLATAAGFLSSLKRIEVSLDHIDKAGISLYDTKISTDLKPSSNWSPSDTLVELKDITYSYYHSEEDEHFMMGPINLAIKSNEMIFMVGGNGSGKTTLAKIMLGLYYSDNGTILFKDSVVEMKHLDSFRSNFSAVFTDAYVFQELYHINESLLESDGQMLIDMLQLTKKVKIKNGQFTTKRLSDGQKKRLSLIISILENKEVYLFDEWAANQDPHFKAIFYTEILEYLRSKQKTIIVITHDDAYFHLADRILKLRDGKLSS